MNKPNHRYLWLGLTLLFPGIGLHAQEMDKPSYYGFIPLSYTRPVEQSGASSELMLFGDKSAWGYVDVNPKDGIDDRRGQNLHNLSVRFAPYLVLNTTNHPKDWKQFWNQGSSWPLYVDVWNTASEGGDLVREDQVDFLKLAGEPCPQVPGTSPALNLDDCRLLGLIQEFDPYNPRAPYYTQTAVSPQYDEFKVLYWNFPGFDPKSWKAEYEDPITGKLPSKYHGFAKTYVHPFIEEVATHREGPLGYELVLQYWFFYPTNDGANNHEGDWEHVNIVVAPRESVTRPQTADEIQWMLDGNGMTDTGADMLVIKRVDYYFHERVWTLDYARPNVYQPRARWQAEVDSLSEERVNETKIWAAVRERAYEDVSETVINHHIIGFVGADSKGNEMLISAPGGRNRDSHGTYPFHGLYKDVGPAGTSEAIQQSFNYREYLDSHRPGLEEGPFGRASVLRFDRADRIELIPDWEHIHPLLYSDPGVRQEWSWMVLPIRWGYPATESLFAGIVAHANTGNLAPQGPSQNKGWNLGRAGSGFHEYDPHQFGGYFALGWQDTFNNNWGFLNATLPTLTILPPFDLAFRVLGAPVALLSHHPPTFFAVDAIPFRFAGISGGYITQDMDEAFLDMFLNNRQLEEILEEVVGGPLGDDKLISTNEFTNRLQGWSSGVSFFVGRRFVSENAFNAVWGNLGQGLVPPGSRAVRQIQGKLDLMEYAGSLRWNFATKSVQPFAKLGYGWAWYRLDNVAIDGVPIPSPTSDRINNFVWHWGVGLEWLPIVGQVPPPRGLDIGLRLDISRFRHGLGLNQISDPIVLALGNAREDVGVVRHSLHIALIIGF